MKKSNRALWGFFAIIVYWACSRQHPDAIGIEGHWIRSGNTTGIAWHYEFHDGLLRQHYEAAGATLSDLTFPYARRGDTLYIGGNLSNQPRTWLLRFECPDVLHVTQPDILIGGEFWLTRK